MSTATERPAGPVFPSAARPTTGAAPGRARGRAGDRAWARPGLLGVLVLAAVLVAWGLTRSGMSNTYYAAAVKSATVSWKALFFGSIDPGSFITVDKPPLAFWLMGLSGRVLGFSSFSMLLPEAVCTVAAVGLLYATVKRVLGSGPALLAAGALAISPVSIAIGRVNDPDALLVFLLVLAAYLVVRAIESGRTRTLAWAGAVVGLAFMTKMLEGWMIVPALAAAYLLAGPPRPWVRVRQLLVAGVAMVVVSAAWPLAVTLWPGSTPYVGGSANGSVWNLIFGYNGFGRIFGASGGQGGGMSFGGAAGWLRLFNEQVGGQIAWLLPLAAVGLAAGLWLTRRAPRTDAARSVYVLFGVWAVVDFAVFSRQQGIFHPYYVSTLAPAVAVLAGAGLWAMLAWARRSWAGVAALAAGVLASAWVAVAVLARTPDFAPWLRTLIPVAAGIAVYGAAALRRPGLLPRRALAVGAVAAVIAVGAGPAAYAVATSGRALNGNNVTAGPATASPGFGPGGGGMGGDQGTSSASLIRYLVAHQGSAKYLVAVSGSGSAAPFILATGKPVVTMGGFNGGDPAPTVSQLAAMVRSGELQYVLLGGGGGGPGGGGTRSAIEEWVQAHGKAVTGAGSSGGTLYRVSA